MQKWIFLQGELLRNLLDIAILYLVIYYLLRIFRGTRAMQVFKGLLLVGILSILGRWLHLEALTFLLDRVWPALILGLIVIFQPEIRRALAQIGQRRFIGSIIQSESNYIGEIARAATTLSKRRVGALIVLEREGNLQRFIDTGITLDAEVKAELMVTIFTPYSPLHDAAVIVQGDRIRAASCLLPLSEKPEVEKTLGTRHRAALGLSEEIDAVVVVVSEETGTISLAVEGQLTRDLDSANLQKIIKNAYNLE